MVKKYIFSSFLLFLGLINGSSVYSQCTPCGSPTTFAVNLSANPDTTFSMTSTRSGLCCGATGTNCIRFDVTINPGANEVSFNVANPAPPGGAFYQVNCGPPTSLGTPLCVTGMTSFCIVFCKSGGDSPTYTISSSRTFSASPDITINSNCVGELYVEGLVQSSITWNSIAPGAAGTYNSYLNCTSACDTTYITPQAGYPTFIDYQVCGTPTGCASGTSCDTVRVNLVPGLEVDITPENATICAGNPITLTANITGGNAPYNYLWSPGGQTTSAISVSVPGTYIVSVSDSTNCPAATDTIVVGAAPLPAAPTASGTTICTGTTATITATAPGGTYEWYNAASGGTLLFTGASYTTPVLVATTTYYVQTTVSGCTSSRTAVTVTVNPNNTVSAASSSPTVCINTAITPITHTTTGATGIGAASGLPAGVTASWAGNTITISGTPSVAGTFNYSIPLAGGCGTVNATGTITVTPNNTVSAASSSPTVCINTAITPITHTTTGATGIGAASGLPTGVTANWAGNTITISGTPTVAGTFNYSIPLTGGCGTVNATGTITVTPNNTVSAASSSPTVCINVAITPITHTTTGATGIGAASGLPAGVTATWAGNTITISGTPTVLGTFNYSIPLAGGCGTVNATGTITVISQNTVSAPSSTPTVCINTAITPITHTTTGATGIGAASGLPAGVTASWAGNTITISGTPSVAGTFNYSIPLTGGCGTVNATGTITVISQNTVSAPSSSPTLCINTAITPITHTTTGATGIGAASGLPTGVTASWAGNTITISGTPTVAGTFNYSIPLTGGCGTVNATGTITVTPNNTVSAASSSPTVCINTAITPITHTTTGATGIGAASGLPTGVTASWAGNTITISGTPTVAGTFNYSIPLTGGCGTVNATGTITVTPNNTVSAASSSPTVCINTAITPITHTTTGATGIGAASGLPTGVTASWAGNTITISGTPSVAGTFNYSIPLTGGCGTVNATGTITVTPNNTVSAASSSPTVCINTAITPITHATTGATGIGAASGLPAGVTASWAGNTITISGTPTVAGTFNYSIPLTGGCGTVNATGTITVNLAPVAPTASDTTICSGNTVTLTATAPGGTYEWYNAASGGTLLFTGASYTTPVLVATTTYYVQTTVSGCMGPRTAVTVTVNPTPAAPTANGTTICEGNSTTLTATAPGGTYEWYNAPTGGTLLFTGATYTTPVLTTTDTFYVQTTVNGCPGPRTAVIVTVTPTDDASFSYSSSTYCVTGTDPTPTINGSFGGTFTSSPAGLVINSSTGSIDVSASALNTYTITFTTSGPCPNSSSVSVTITNAPDATFSYTTPICQSGSNELPSFPPGASAGVFSASPAGLVFVSTSTGEINTAASTFGTYTITNFIAAAGGCSSASANFTITIDEAATVNAGTYSDICAGTTLSLNGTIGGSATTGTWSGGTGTYAPNATTLNATYTPSAAEQTAGIVTLVLTTDNPAGACTAAADTVSINIIPLPAAPTVNDTTICEGSSTTLTATAPGGTYEWYNAVTGGTLLNTGATYTTPVLTTTTSYYVQTTVNGCAGPRATVTVTVNPTPAAPTVNGDTICAGETTILTATAPGGTYDWYDAPTGGTLLFTGANYTTPALTTTDTFYVQTTVLGCPSTRTMVIVVVNPIPTAPIVGNTTICEGGTATLTATSPGGIYEWYDAPTGGNLVNTGATYTTPILTTTTSYYVQTTVNGCTSAMTTVTVTVNPIPVAPTVNDTTICEGNTVTLTATSPGGTYRWYNAPTGGTLLNTGANYTTPILTTTTTYYVQTTVGGCTSPRTSVTVTVIPNDDPSFSYSSGTFCITGTDPTPTVTGTSGGTFSSSPSGLTINPSTGEITVSSSTLGTYTVTYTTNGTCPMSSSVSVTITTAPDATFSYNDPFCQFTTNPLPIFPIGSSAGVFSATPAGLNFVNTSTGEIDLSTSAFGTYTITNFIAASGGCASASHSTTVVIEEAAIVNAGNDTTICVGDLAVLNGSIGGSATAATWSGGAGTFNPNNTTLNATYTPTAGEYLAGLVSLVLTTNNPGGVCTAASDTVIITFNEDDPSFTYSSGTYCATGTNPVPNITGGSTGTFSATPAGLVFVNTTTGEINLGASALGTYTVSFTTNGSCPASSSMSITITNGFDASFSYTTPVCQGGANEFPSFTPGASSGIFSATPSGLVFVNTSTGEIDMTASTPGTYTVTNFIAASGGCASATHSTTFTIDVSATVNAGADMSICFGDNAPLSGAIGGSATSGTWSGGLGTFSPNNTTLTATYTPDPFETLVTLILTSDDPAGPCSAVSDSVVITINPIPAAPTASNDTICEGTSTTLIATAPGGTYEWYSASSGGTLLNAGASFTTPVLSTTTTYYVQTTVNGCTSSTRTPVTVTVTPLDDPSFSYSSATFCVSGGNATPVITGGSTGSFSATPSGLVFVDSLTGEIDVALTTLGTYTVTFTTDGVCPDSATFTVTITNAPDATFSYNDPFCTNGSNPTPTFPPGSSAGVFSALPAGLVFVSTSTGQINLSASTPGVYAVTNDIAAAGGCAAASYTDSVEILPAPLADAGVDTSVCANNAQVDLSGSIANAGGMSWTTSGDGIFTPDTISANVTYNAGTNDTVNGSVIIYLTTTQNGFCSAAVDSIVLTITPAPLVDAGSDILICNGTLIASLNGSVTGGSSTGAWTTMGTGTFSPDSLTLNASYTFSQQDSINGSVILILESTNNGGCLAVYDTVEVFLSSPATVFAGNDTTICANNDSIQLNGQVFGGTGAGVWSSSGNGTFTPSANDLNASYQIDSSDIANGSVMLILDAVNSCVPAADTIVITINPAPIADAGNNFSICEGETASLNGSITNAGGGEWTTDGTGTFVPDNFTLNAQYIPSAGDMVNGTVMLVLTTTNNGLCDAVSDTITLTISPLPIADFIPQGGQFNINQVIDFMNQSQNATTYFWNFGNNGDTSILSNPSYSYGANGIYTVTLIATNSAGCVDTITYDFEIIGDDVKPVVVPTAFSPNGDGNNDVFSILGGPFESYQLTVYNEWGQEIFMSDDQADGWDGTFKGTSQPSGSYVYVFTGVTIADETITLQGEIAIIR